MLNFATFLDITSNLVVHGQMKTSLKVVNYDAFLKNKKLFCYNNFISLLVENTLV